jgi:hypothetical protein
MTDFLIGQAESTPFVCRTRPAADKLTFAERTADTHVSNIVTKLG